MKNFIKVFGILGSFWVLSFFSKDLLQNPVFAKEALRAEDSIVVNNGRVTETGILTDDKGFIFLEFIKDTHVSNVSDKQPFVGEILPPQIIEMEWKKPRGRMNEIITFEILSDTSDDLVFIDKFTLIRSDKERLRLETKSPDDFLRTGGFQLYTKISKTDKIGLPSLWQYLNEKNEWKKMGGKLESSPEDDIKIFSVTLTKTGIYTIFDENPAPTYSESVDPALIEKVESSPFPSVLPPILEEESIPEHWINDNFEASILEDDEIWNEETNQPIIIPAVADNTVKQTNQSQTIQNPSQKPFHEPVSNKLAPNTIPSVINKELPERLPTAGAIKTKNNFPFLVIFAFGILGTSVYLGFSNRY